MRLGSLLERQFTTYDRAQNSRFQGRSHCAES